MGDSFLTVAGISESELTIKSSRFIGVLMPCPDSGSIKPLISDVRARYPDARHYCYAAVYGGPAGETRSSDDGEPSGTAGKPILSVLRGAGLSDCLCVVVRYFGGTLLGTGGLVHAYTEAAKGAVENAETVPKTQCTVYRFTLDYRARSNFDTVMAGLVAEPPGCVYGQAVEMRCLVPSGRKEEFLAKLSDLSGRRAVPIEEGTEYA